MTLERFQNFGGEIRGLKVWTSSYPVVHGPGITDSGLEYYIKGHRRGRCCTPMYANREPFFLFYLVKCAHTMMNVAL